MKKHVLYAIFGISLALMCVAAQIRWKKWENFETRKRARRTFVHNLCAFCGRVHGFAECKGVGVVLRRVAARRVLRLPLTTRGEWV